MGYRYKRIKLNLGSILPIYVFLWPFLSMLVQVDALSFFIDNRFILIDLRLFFYALFLGACLFKFSFSQKKIQKQKIILLLIIFIFNFFYILSFLVNWNSVTIDYKQFINGFFLFSILSSYAILCSDLIDWKLVAKLYALLLIVVSIFGFYSFSRFSTLGIQILSGGLSEQLFRLAGGKAFWIPSVLILAFTFFEFKHKTIKSTTITIALLLSNILLLLSSQRNAVTVIAYELLIFSSYYTATKVVSLFVLIASVLLIFSQKIFVVLSLTLFHKLNYIEASVEPSRLDIWQATIDALTSNIKHVVFGVAEGGLPSVSGSNWPMDSDNPHNILLYFWATTGIAGMVSFMFIVAMCAYFVHRKKKLHQIIFYWLFVASLIFVGFSFYENSTKSDILNLGIVIAFGLIFHSKNSKHLTNKLTINQDSSRLNESYS